jgi:hypothetical protein
VAAPEPSRAVERGKCYLTRGFSGALPGQEAGPEAMGHMVACRWTPCFGLDLERVYRGTRSAGCQHRQSRRLRHWPCCVAKDLANITLW